jgi:acyl-CoA synthetase (AMP-forming)/AMP-acid ligase II
LAEATLVVSSGRREYEPVFREVDRDELSRGTLAPPTARSEERTTPATLVSSGRVGFGTTVAIVDPERLTRCAPGAIGEIWISSPSVAGGYWNRPEETARTFAARIAGEDGPSYLRTGDSGALIDGELYVAGRLKDVIIVRGANHYPQDIEATVERLHPAIRAGGVAAFSVEGDREEQVVVALEIDPREIARSASGRPRIHPKTPLTPDARAILAHVAALVRTAVMEEHGLQLHAVAMLHPGGIPKTSSGKLRRHAAAQAFARDELHEIERFTGVVSAAPPLLKTGT